jgi:diacylglycerol kinase (ATP)
LKNPPASIYPLGTGNDLSRVLGWGRLYKSRGLLRTLTQITDAHPVALDRWKIQIETLEENASGNESVDTRRRFFSFTYHPKFIRHADQPEHENHRTPINTFFFNYISFGLDAAVVLDFQVRRTRDPSKFTSPFKNKIFFINESRKYFNDFAFGIAWNLSSYMRLICDGQDLTDSIRHCHSLVLLNTRGFGAGTHPWGRTSTNRISPANTREGDQMKVITTDAIAHATVNNFEAQDFGDRKIEVLGLNTRQMALIHIGFHGNRIAQCSQVRIELSHPMPVHMDGEAFCLAGSTAVNIIHAGQVMVLRNENR